MRGLLAAFGFLTRIPVPLRVFADPDARVRSLPWYPLVGLVLGLVLLVLAAALAGAPPLLRGMLLLLAWVALTGGMHLDGLADSADAWVGGLGSRERTLAIMKDPACGPMGVLALVLVLGLKFTALASLGGGDWAVLLIAPMLARAAFVAAFLALPYVRTQGLGSRLAEAPRGACLAALGATAVACMLAGGWHGVLTLLAGALVFVLWRRACLARLGGMTGDLCGALGEILETVVLVAWCL